MRDEEHHSQHKHSNPASGDKPFVDGPPVDESKGIHFRFPRCAYLVLGSETIEVLICCVLEATTFEPLALAPFPKFLILAIGLV